MGSAQWWTIDVLLPVILLIALVWLAFLREPRRGDRMTEESGREVYPDEKRPRRDGTDDR